MRFISLIIIHCSATPEGKSTVELGRNFGCAIDDGAADQMDFVEFTAQSKMSGVNLKDGTRVRKGASEAIKTFVKEAGGIIPPDLEGIVTEVSNLGGTPLVVCVNNKILGVIYLKDTVKPGLVERFERLREIGIKTIMCTGDNPLTAATIAKEAGVDGFIAEWVTPSTPAFALGYATEQDYEEINRREKKFKERIRKILLKRIKTSRCPESVGNLAAK